MTKTAVIAAAASFSLVVLLVPIVMKLSARWNLYDLPGPLKLHARPTSRLGGLAVTLAILGASLISTRASATAEWSFFPALVLICAVGAIDDIRGLSAAVRLVAQFVAGALLWSSCGRMTLWHSAGLGLVAACTFTVAIVNALNFLDGADGIASGVGGVIAIGYGLFAWPAPDRLAIVVAWAVAGSCAGFSLFNFPARGRTARIFLGDGGSTSLGLCIAYLGLRFYDSPFARGPQLLFPLMAAALPLLDVALATVRRVRAGDSPLTGDRRHLSDLLAARGMSARAVALTCCGVATSFILIGLAAWLTKPVVFLVLTILSIGAALTAAIRIGALQGDTSGEKGAQGSFGGLDRSGQTS